jgi:hypothetical protein
VSEIRCETFFRPPPVACERLTIPAALYNACRLALSRCDYETVFVPVRSMQILAVIEPGEVFFVDSLAYAMQDGEGGKLVCLSWSFIWLDGRSDLSAPAPIEMLYYREDARQLHGRLVGELQAGLDRLQERDCGPRIGRVLPLRP